MATATMKTYEAMFLLPAGASAELEKSTAMIRGMIEKHGGQILVIKKWDERKLAYEMGPQKRGLYILVYYKGPANSITAIEREVNLSEDIIRVLVTHADHLNETEMAAVEPQPIQPREERAPWDRPGFNLDDRRGPRRDDQRRDDRSSHMADPAAKD